jgi:hypothetical protein
VVNRYETPRTRTAGLPEGQCNHCKDRPAPLPVLSTPTTKRRRERSHTMRTSVSGAATA